MLDTIGGDTLEKSWTVLREGGRILTLVELGIKPHNRRLGEAVFFTSATPWLSEAAMRFRAGELQIVTDSIFSLEETRAAMEKQATGHARGRWWCGSGIEERHYRGRIQKGAKVFVCQCSL